MKMKMKMKKIFLYILIVMFMFGCTGEEIYKNTMKQRADLANLNTKNIIIDDGFKVEYYENNVNSDKTLVLLHGFGDDKDTWLQFTQGLFNRYHVIIPDLIGYGNSSKPFNIDYSMDAQSDRLKQFLDKFNYKNLILIGNSMGGGIAIKYANKYDVNALVLISPMGVKGKKTSYFEKLSKDERTELIYDVCSGEKMENLLNLYMYRIPFMTNSVLDYLAQRRCENNDLIKYQSKYIYDKNFDVQYTLRYETKRIDVPTYILWGKKDKALDVSNAKTFNRLIKNSKLKTYNNVGHLPMVEIPYISALDVGLFINNLK